jgi:hypothetical protein
MALLVLSGQHGPVTPILLDLVQRLLPLGEWEPVGAMLEQARMALANEGGLTAGELDRMRRWADRWSSLHVRLRLFYLECHSDGGVSHALLCVLEGREPTGPLVGAVREAWERWDGGACPFDLIPWRQR